MTPLAKQTILRAKEAVGVSEDKPYRNRGKWVDVYTRFLGLLGVPWCACFVAFKIHQAAKDLKRPCRWPKAPWAAGCDAIYRWAKKNDLLLSQPVPGCVFLVGTEKDFTHTGFVSEVIINRVITIEGNTNNDGSREGYEVCQRVRQIRELTYIAIV